MKKTQRLGALVGVLLLLCLTVFLVSRQEEKKEQIRTTNETILAIDPDTVSELSWNYNGNSLRFTNDGGWLWDEDAQFPVDEDVVTALLADFSDFRAAFTIESPDDLSAYGLSNPVGMISLTADGTTVTIQLGTVSTMDQQRYISIGDGNVYLAESDPAEDFDKDISAMIRHDVLPSLLDAEELTLSGAWQYTALKDESAVSMCAEDVWFIDGSPLDTDTVRGYLRTVGNTPLTDYVNYKVTEDELASYGLDEPELVIFAVLPGSDESEPDTEIRLSIGRESAAVEAAEDESEVPVYARVGDSAIIYQIPYSRYTSLMAGSVDDLRHKEVFTGSFDEMYMMTVSLDGTIYTFSPIEEEGVKTWYLSEDQEADISSLTSAVSAITVDSFTSDVPEDREEISLTIYLDNGNYPEYTLALYRVDGKTCLACVNGEPFGYISRSAAVDLIEAVNALVL